MTFASLALLAQAADGTTRTVLEWGRAEENADLILPIAVCLGVMLFVRAMYRRDAVDLPPVLGWLLTAMIGR